ncbi:MAG: hypothetical protein QXN77_09550 [Candidatus Caldarchaeum sp.]
MNTKTGGENLSSIIRLGEVAKPSRVYLKGSMIRKRIIVLFDPTEYSTTSTADVLISSGHTRYDGAEYLSVTVKASAQLRTAGATATLTINLYDNSGGTTTITFSNSYTSYDTFSRVIVVNGFVKWEIWLRTSNSSYAAYAKFLEIIVTPETDGVTFHTDNTEKTTTSTTYVTVASGTPNYPSVPNFRVYVMFRFNIRTSGGTVWAKIIVTDMNNIDYSYVTSTISKNYIRIAKEFIIDGLKSWQIQMYVSSSSYTGYLNNIKINYAYVYYAGSLTPRDLNASIMFLKQLTIGPGDYLYIDDDNVRKTYINPTGLEMIIELDPPLPVNKINFPNLDANIVADFLVIE